MNELLVTKLIRPVTVFGCLVAFLLNSLGVPHLLRGSNLSEVELQIIWSVFSLYVVMRGGKQIAESVRK
jgi:hypothetical protein